MSHLSRIWKDLRPTDKIYIQDEDLKWVVMRKNKITRGCKEVYNEDGTFYGLIQIGSAGHVYLTKVEDMALAFSTPDEYYQAQADLAHAQEVVDSLTRRLHIHDLVRKDKE